MLFHGYIDDSADQKRQRLVIAGAIIGMKEDWRQLDRRWNERLEQDGLQYYKSSHCETLNGQFHKFRKWGIQEGKIRALKVRDDRMRGPAPFRASLCLRRKRPKMMREFSRAFD